LPGIVARVVKEDGSLAGYEEPGELIIKTPSVALGYANNAQAYVVILCVSGALFMNVRGNAGLKRHLSTGARHVPRSLNIRRNSHGFCVDG
jgi:acyl-CoA synthetase (AMP-forming)/AMP-acid ligase II